MGKRREEEEGGDDVEGSDDDADAGETPAIRVTDVVLPSIDGSTTMDDGPTGARATGAASVSGANGTRVNGRSMATSTSKATATTSTEAARCARLEQLRFRAVSHHHTPPQHTNTSPSSPPLSTLSLSFIH